jgi:hypothetical protein
MTKGIYPTLRTPLCDLLGCDVPILLAGMGGVSRWELAAAVARAGGYPTLGMVRETPRYRDVGTSPASLGTSPAALAASEWCAFRLRSWSPRRSCLRSPDSADMGLIALVIYFGPLQAERLADPQPG